MHSPSAPVPYPMPMPQSRHRAHQPISTRHVLSSLWSFCCVAPHLWLLNEVPDCAPRRSSRPDPFLANRALRCTSRGVPGSSNRGVLQRRSEPARSTVGRPAHTTCAGRSPPCRGQRSGEAAGPAGAVTFSAPGPCAREPRHHARRFTLRRGEPHAGRSWPPWSSGPAGADACHHPTAVSGRGYRLASRPLRVSRRRIRKETGSGGLERRPCLAVGPVHGVDRCSPVTCGKIHDGGYGRFRRRAHRIVTEPTYQAVGNPLRRSYTHE